MRIILVGAPGSGKRTKGRELRDALGNVELHDVMGDLYGDLQLGDLCDYRTEVAIATDRVDLGSGIHTHSLIDSLAHSATRLHRMMELKNVSDQQLLRWQVTTGLISLMLVDSFRHDLIFFLKGNDGSEFGKTLEFALRATLEESELDFHELTDIEEAATLVRKHGQREVDPEPNK